MGLVVSVPFTVVVGAGVICSWVVVGAVADDATDVVATVISVASSSATVVWGDDTEVELVDAGKFS